MHYIKIWTSILDGTLADDYETRHIFEDLLKLATADGIVDMTPSAIAARIRVPTEKVERSIELLLAPDPESRRTHEGGARIVRISEHRSWGYAIVNFAYYRGLQSSDREREMAAERQRRRRSRELGTEPRDPHRDSHAPSRPVTLRHDRKKEEGKRQKEEKTKTEPPTFQDPPLNCEPSGNANVGGDLASLGRRPPPSSGGNSVEIPVRVKVRSNEIRLELVPLWVASELAAEYPGVDVGDELLEVRRWCLEQVELPRRGALWTRAMPGIHRWLRRAARDARNGRQRASPARNHRAAVDAAYRHANAPHAPPAEAEDALASGVVDPISEHLVEVAT